MRFKELTFHRALPGTAARLRETDFSRLAIEDPTHTTAASGLGMVDEAAGAYVLELDGVFLFQFGVVRRDIPAATLTAAVKRRAAAAAQSLGRPLLDHEVRALRAPIEEELRSKVIPRMRYHWAGIDTQAGFVWIEAAAQDTVNDFYHTICRALGQGHVVTQRVSPHRIYANMTHWVLRNALPDTLQFGRTITVEDLGDKSKITMSDVPIPSSTVSDAMKGGERVVARLALHWRNSVSFSLTSPLALHSVRLSPLIEDKITTAAEDDTQLRCQMLATWTPHLRAILAFVESLNEDDESTPSAEHGKTSDTLPFNVIVRRIAVGGQGG